MANSSGQFTLRVSVSNILKSEPSCTSYKLWATFQRWQVSGRHQHGMCPHAATQSYTYLYNIRNLYYLILVSLSLSSYTWLWPVTRRVWSPGRGEAGVGRCHYFLIISDLTGGGRDGRGRENVGHRWPIRLRIRTEAHYPGFNLNPHLISGY